MFNSLTAASAESDPCTKFSATVTPKSPLMVPGAALAGSVAPIIDLTIAQLSSGPVTSITTDGDRVMNSTNSLKKGLLACSA